jgi:hypothetical protein
MKKILLSILALTSMASAFSQTTITEHFEWALSNIASPKIAVYNWSAGNFVSGNNSFGDKASAQLFDSQLGITGPGTVSNVKTWIPIKNDQGGSIDIKIYANNGGAIGTELGSSTITIASIDTTQAGIGLITSGADFLGVYNVDVTFASPIAFTADGFFAVYTFGTGANVVAGGTTVDSVAAYSLAGTHSGVISSTDAFDNYAQYNLNVAHAIFPTVTFDAPSAIGENKLDVTIYAFENELFVNSTENLNNAQVNILNTMGQTVDSFNVNGTANRFNLSNLSAGVYLVNIYSEGAVKTSKITIN